MSQLYKLTGQMAELAAMAETDDEGLKQAIQDTMDAVQGEFADKADSIVMLRRNLEGDITAIDSEIDRLSELKRIKANSVGQLNDYLRRNMEAANIKTIKRPLFTITLALGREKVVIDDKDAVPDELMSVTTKIEPDKAAIAATLKAIRAHNQAVQARIAVGEDTEFELLPLPAWARLERTEKSIRIV